LSDYKLPVLPPKFDFETKTVLKQLVNSNRALAELKGYTDTIPNKHILINAVAINEAKDSSAIENIITTHDELYKAMSSSINIDGSAKEVVNYRKALWYGYQLVKKHGFITINNIIEIQSVIVENNAGIRKIPGTVLKNESTGEIVYTPPAGESEILKLLDNLEKYINEDDDGLNYLINLAILHYQFECIHPFFDGNGRAGRIINVLYIVLKGLLDSPILYLSSYIIKNKANYYRLLQEVRVENKWEDWIIFILKGIEETAYTTLSLVKKFNNEIENMCEEIKNTLPKIYSKELINLLFYEFYTKIDYIKKGLDVTRKTASNYLSTLEKAGFLVSDKIGKERIYQNKRLYDLVKHFR